MQHTCTHARAPYPLHDVRQIRSQFRNGRECSLRQRCSTSSSLMEGNRCEPFLHPAGAWGWRRAYNKGGSSHRQHAIDVVNIDN